MPHTVATDYMPDLTGRIIDNGRLQLLDSLGSGAYGKVYRALDRTSPRGSQVFYAVKCLFRPQSFSQEAFQMREFRVHQLVCGHPNIVTLHRIVYDHDFTYVVLDLCTGGDLFTAITETHVFNHNVKLIKKIFVQLIDAVQYCHDQGVFHRDLKPENVLRTKDGSSICLADFGLSTQRKFSKDFGCGSSYYMSPECIGHKSSPDRYSTPHSDIWSLGVILTNMISCQNPWRYATTRDECFSAYLDNPEFLREVLPISRGANEILKRIFHIDPFCRISLAELREQVLALDTFFLDEEQALLSSHLTATYSGTSHVSSIVFKKDTSTQDANASVSSDEVYAFHSPCDDHPPSSASPVISSARTGISGSDTDSDGPITPETHPVDPAVEVPDLPEGETLEQSAVIPASGVIYEEASQKPLVQGMKHRRKRFFRKALRRFMDLPTDTRSL